jgi:hypothetical protein
VRACRRDDHRIAKVHIEHDTQLTDEASGLTPQHFLAYFGDEDIFPLVQNLIDRLVDLEASCNLAAPCTVGQLDMRGTLADETPLLLAVAQSSLTEISVFVTLGADPFNGAEKYEPHTGAMSAQK